MTIQSDVIIVTKLTSGYYHVRGAGPCNWAQVPTWPCSREVLVEHSFPDASPEFIELALRASAGGGDE